MLRSELIGTVRRNNLTFNQRVPGSSPGALTNVNNNLGGNARHFKPGRKRVTAGVTAGSWRLARARVSRTGESDGLAGAEPGQPNDTGRGGSLQVLPRQSAW